MGGVAEGVRYESVVVRVARGGVRQIMYESEFLKLWHILYIYRMRPVVVRVV